MDSAQKAYDVVVVGSGLTGSWAAKTLTEQGCRVLLLEAGRTLTDQDFEKKPENISALGRIISAFRRGQLVQARCGAYMPTTRDLYVNDRANPYTTPPKKPFLWFRGRQVGGRMHTWARMSLRLSDLEFKPYSHDGFDMDWPIGSADLDPYYTAVESFCGVHGEKEGIDLVPDGTFIEPNAMTEREKEFRTVVEEKWPTRRVISARTMKYDPNNRVPALTAALDSGRLTIQPDAVVQRILVDPNTGRATGVSYVNRQNKEVCEVHAGAVVLCASAIESVRILLNSKSDKFPEGIGNQHDLVGRYITDHVMVGLFGPEKEAYEPPLKRVDEFDFSKIMGFYMPGFRNTGGDKSEFLRSYGIQGYLGRRNRWGIFAFGEMLPRHENRVTLHPRRTDRWGIPIAHIDTRHGENELKMIEDQKQTLLELADLAGVEPPTSGIETNFINALIFKHVIKKVSMPRGKRRADASIAFFPGVSIHELGGARMGAAPENSVLNAFNQCWECENLLVADGACMVSGGYQNTSLTLMALAGRASEHLAKHVI